MPIVDSSILSTNDEAEQLRSLFRLYASAINRELGIDHAPAQLLVLIMAGLLYQCLERHGATAHTDLS